MKDVIATTAAVIGDPNLSLEIRDLKRRSTPAIHNLYGKFFDANLVYHRNIHMEVEGGDKMLPAKDVLSVRLHMNRPKDIVLAELKKVLDPRAYDEIKTHLETHDELPEHHRNILTLAGPESANGAPDIKSLNDRMRSTQGAIPIKDITLENLADKIQQIRNGFGNMKEDGEAYSEMNVHLASIIAYAKACPANANGDPIVVKKSISFDGADKYQSRVKQSKRVTPWEEFKAKWEANGVHFQDFARNRVIKENGQAVVKLLVFFSFGQENDNGSHIILRTPKIKELGNISKRRDLLEIKRKEDLKSLEGFQYGCTSNYDYFGATYLFKLINYNIIRIFDPMGKKYIKGLETIALKLLRQHGYFQSKYGRPCEFELNKTDGETCKSFLDKFARLWDTILNVDQPDNLKAFENFECPIWNGKLEFPLSKDHPLYKEDPFSRYYAFGDEILAAYCFVSLDNIIPSNIGKNVPIQGPRKHKLGDGDYGFIY